MPHDVRTGWFSEGRVAAGHELTKLERPAVVVLLARCVAYLSRLFLPAYPGSTAELTQTCCWTDTKAGIELHAWIKCWEFDAKLGSRGSLKSRLGRKSAGKKVEEEQTCGRCEAVSSLRWHCCPALLRPSSL